MKVQAAEAFSFWAALALLMGLGIRYPLKGTSSSSRT